MRDRARAERRGRQSRARELRRTARLGSVSAKPMAIPTPGRGCAPRARSAPAPGPALFPTSPAASRTPATTRYAADIAHFKAALAASNPRDGLHDVDRAGQLLADRQRLLRQADEAFLYASAPEAMREEYIAILDGGLILQIDDPSIAENWDMIVPEPSVDDYRASSRPDASTRSITRCAGFPATASASISAGGAGTAPTSRTFPCAISSTSCSR